MFELSFEQKMAAEAPENRVVVVAGAGSGKTATLVGRLKFLIEQGVNLKNVYAITYTNNAAQEMRERLPDGEYFIGTIHSLANKILLQNGISTSAVIQEENFSALFKMIKSNNISYPEIDYILVDEFQDVSEEEFSFIFNDLKPKSFFVVGDSRQAIFGFKGCNYKFFNSLIFDSRNTVYELTENYRNPKEIIQFATRFIAGMEDIYFTEVECLVEEKGFVNKTDFMPSDLVKKIKISESYKDWFVLCRTNQQVQDLLTIFNKSNIPAVSFKKSEKTFEEMKTLMSSNAVKVFTIHSAKGLESKFVAVIGARTFNAEEKRLCYVAATRAKNTLIWYKNTRGKRRESEIIEYGFCDPSIKKQFNDRFKF